MIRNVLVGYGWFATYYAILVTGFYFFIIAVSFIKIFGVIRRSRFTPFHRLSGSRLLPPISVLVPAYNEEMTILENVKSLLCLNYPSLEVIVINDGSQDRTLQKLMDTFDLKPFERARRESLDTAEVRGIYHNPAYPKLFVLDKVNSGKADSLNAGVNFSRYPMVASIDADSLLEKDALLRIAEVYMENPEEIVAIGGNVRIGNGCTIENGRVRKVGLSRKLVPLLQSIEYLAAFIGGRIGLSALNGLLIVSGAFGVFRKDRLIQVGGYRGGYPGEDMNIILKLHKTMLDEKKPYRIAYCPDAVCWTQGPDSLRVLGNQRKRWGRGNLINMLEFCTVLFRPRYRMFGLVSVPYTIFFETLNPYVRITGLLALIGYWFLDMTTWPVLLAYWGINVLSLYLLKVGSFFLEELAFHSFPKGWDLFRLVLFTHLIFFGYYQLSLIWWIQGHWDYFRNKNTWGAMTRTSWNAESKDSSAGG